MRKIVSPKGDVSNLAQMWDISTIQQQALQSITASPAISRRAYIEGTVDSPVCISQQPLRHDFGAVNPGRRDCTYRHTSRSPTLTGRDCMIGEQHETGDTRPKPYCVARIRAGTSELRTEAASQPSLGVTGRQPAHADTTAEQAHSRT